MALGPGPLLCRLKSDPPSPGRCVLSILLVALPLAGARGQTVPVERSVTIDSRWLTNGYSQPAAEGFGLELMSWTRWPAEVVAPLDRPPRGDGFLVWSPTGSRNLTHGLVAFVTGTLFGTALQHSLHEFGHGTRIAALGYEPWYTHDDPVFDPSGAPIRSAGTAYDGFFGYLLSSFFDQSGATLARDDRTRFTPLAHFLEDEGWLGLIAMGGLNAEASFSQAVEGRIREEGGHVGLIVPFIGGKLSARAYSTGTSSLNDMSNILSFYEARGYGITRDDVRRASLVSVLASATSYRLVWAGVGMFAGRRPDFRPRTLGPFELPGTTLYLNRQGMSYHVDSAVRHGAWRLPFAVEQVFSGTDRTEVTVGAEWDGSVGAVQTGLIVGQGVGVRFRTRWTLQERVAVGVGYAAYDSENLRGAREIASLEDGTRFHEAHITLGWVF